MEIHHAQLTDPRFEILALGNDPERLASSSNKHQYRVLATMEINGVRLERGNILVDSGRRLEFGEVYLVEVVRVTLVDIPQYKRDHIERFRHQNERARHGHTGYTLIAWNGRD